ncbi:delta-sarcoglycan isoform X2 [Planococcus citri]|uniref:delta-sarcoglycan isoform X2 n=1 Tax=Planococcus citri TaxID=170843 RepID=UPI0031F7BC1C
MSHQTEEWIKMLPSSSRGENAGPSSLEEEISSSKPRARDPTRTQIGIYGWRKKCLFAFMLALGLIVVFNICLTMWFMEVLQFSSDGIGMLKIIEGGVMLKGKAYFMNSLVASSINSKRGKSLRFVSAHNISVSVRNSGGREVSNFILKNDTATFSASSFNITGSRGEVLFSASKDEVVFGTNEVKFTGSSGAVFEGSVQTPTIKGHYKRELSLESVTRMVDIFGPEGVILESRAGDIHVICLRDLKLQSVAGAIKLESSKVYLPGLQAAKTTSVKSSIPNNVTVYQVCVCENGKLFLSPADGECIPDFDICR